MKKHQRDQRGRAITWRNTASGKRYLIRFQIALNQMAGVAAMSAANIAAIQAAPATTPEERAKKALAIAQTIIDSRLAQMGLCAKLTGQAN